MARKAQKSLPLKNPMWELFCQFYTKNVETFNNITRSYAAANKIDLDSLPKDDAVFDNVEVKPGVFEYKKIKDSTYDQKFMVCAASGSRLLNTVKINDRVQTLLAESMSDELVDAELAWVIRQRVDLGPKVSAAREYNAMRGRTVKKIELTGANGERLFDDETKAKRKEALKGYIARR